MGLDPTQNPQDSPANQVREPLPEESKANEASKAFEFFTVYLYDLPKFEYASHKLAEVLKKQANILLSDVPVIDRHPRKEFFTGRMQIRCRNKEDYHEMCEKIRYFEIDGKECRALCHEKQFKRGDKGLSEESHKD